MEERQVPLLLALQVGEAEHAFEPRTIQIMELFLLSSLWNAVKKLAAQVVYPSTEDELLASVAEAVQKNQKMRVVTRYAHSIPKLVCPSGDSGLIISTRDLDYVVSVDKPSVRMTFQSSVTLKNLIDVAAREGLALPHCPYWLGVTLGGMLGTGAHGSSLFGKGSVVHEYVVGMRLVVPASPVEGYAKVVSLTEADEDLNAAKVWLGVIGVIS